MATEPKLDVIPPSSGKKKCHRFFVQMAFPVPDKLMPNKMNVAPQVANFDCMGEACMLWNEEEKECWEKTAAKGQALQGQYAFNKMNDVHMEHIGG